jgi:uncharacterized protein
MSLRRLAAAQYRVMPWRNGKGSTTEIAAAPEGAGTGEFDWRISVAEVTAPAEFSPFPGVDRVITVIDGEGMAMLVGGRPHRLELLRPFAFAGEDAVSATLLAGETHAFNVMVRRGRLAAVVDVLRPDPEGMALPPHAGTALLYAASGAAELVVDRDAAAFGAEETLVAEGFAGGRLVARTSPHATVLLVRLSAG